MLQNASDCTDFDLFFKKKFRGSMPPDPPRARACFAGAQIAPASPALNSLSHHFPPFFSWPMLGYVNTGNTKRS